MTPPTAAAPPAELTLDDINLLEDTWAAGVPNEQFRLLRREAPVFWHPHPTAKGFWAVTKHEDIKYISRHDDVFSTELGSTFLIDHTPEALELVRMTLLNMDPPKHSRYRRLVSAGFKPRMIQALVEQIQQRAEGIVAELEGRDEVEFVEDVAAELPLQVICELLGVPNEDRHLIFDWSNRMVGGQDPDFQATEEDGQLAAAEIYLYCDNLAAERAALVPELPADLVTLYDRIRSSSSGAGIGAAALHNGRCNGCRMPLAPTELSRIEKLPPDEIVRCDECRRILVRVG